MAERTWPNQPSHRVYASVHGDGPFECEFCNEPILVMSGPLCSERLIIHHLDGDHSNDAPDNLVAAHHGCHVRHHYKEHWANHTGLAEPSAVKRSQEKQHAAQVGRPKTAQHRANISQGLRGRYYSPETRAKLSAAATANQTGRPRVHPKATCSCGRTMNPGGLVIHLRANPDHI